MTDASRIALCPGSYDPATKGHLDIILRARSLFSTVIVGVIVAPHRKAPVFSIQERVEFLQYGLEGREGISVKPFDGLVVDFAKNEGATTLVKGLRAISDFEYELQMAGLNRKLAPEIETLYLMASPEYSFLSSSGVKEIATFGGEVTQWVTDPVAQALRRLQK